MEARIASYDPSMVGGHGWMSLRLVLILKRHLNRA
jgi:hypothetical protein